MDVAVKTLQICKDATERRNFEREMAISADPRLKHPNIVKVYGLVEGGIIIMHIQNQLIKYWTGSSSIFMIINLRSFYALSGMIVSMNICMQWIKL